LFFCYWLNLYPQSCIGYYAYLKADVKLFFKK
jgi:hypothetical protein